MTRRSLFATIAAAIAGPKLAPASRFEKIYPCAPLAILGEDRYHPKLLLSVPDGFEAWSHGRRLRRGDSYTSLYLIPKP